MTSAPQLATLSVDDVRQWLVDKIAVRLEVEKSNVDVEAYFDEFDLDSIEALVLAAELEKWLGFELEPTAMWYHPTIAQLAEHIAETAHAKA